MACALDNDPINQLEENLQCSVCLEVLTDPRTLPCCHSFCKHCLERIVKSCRGKAPRRQPIREFPCPNCRATFILDPEKHVADMPRNNFICNMVKVAAVLDRGIGAVPCSHNCSQSYSVARCVTCEKFLCKECLTAHNNYRGHNGHSVLTMEELSKPENRKKINEKMHCSEHSGMELKVYCETCDQLICRDCMDFKHVKHHSCVLVKDEANKYKELLASNNKAMQDALTEGNAFLQRLTLTTEQLDRDAENIRIQITQKKDIVLKTVTEMLEEKTKTLLKKVDDIRKAKGAKVEKQTEETKLYVEKMKTSVQLSKKLVDQGTEGEIISSQKMMLDNAKNLLTNREKYFKAPIPVVKLRYSSSTGKEPINEEISKGLVNSLGDVNFENEDGADLDELNSDEIDLKRSSQKGSSREKKDIFHFFTESQEFKKFLLETREKCLGAQHIPVAKLSYRKAILNFKDEDCVDSDEVDLKRSSQKGRSWEKTETEKKTPVCDIPKAEVDVVASPGKKAPESVTGEAKEPRKIDASFTRPICQDRGESKACTYIKSNDGFVSDEVDLKPSSQRRNFREKKDIVYVPTKSRQLNLKNEVRVEEVGLERFSRTGSSWESTERRGVFNQRRRLDIFRREDRKPATDDKSKCRIL